MNAQSKAVKAPLHFALTENTFGEIGWQFAEILHASGADINIVCIERIAPKHSLENLALVLESNN